MKEVRGHLSHFRDRGLLFIGCRPRPSSLVTWLNLKTCTHGQDQALIFLSYDSSTQTSESDLPIQSLLPTA